jgi:TonB family protein
MKINVLKISKMSWIPAVCLMVGITSCDLTQQEAEIEGPTQVEAKPSMGPTNIASRLTDVAKDGKEIFDVTEVQPNPPGGMAGWSKYLSENLKYPTEAKSMGIEGTVIVVFVVNSDGSISDAEILRGIGAGADEEALRVVQNSPNWTPAKQKDRVVNSRMRLPVRFKLS